MLSADLELSWFAVLLLWIALTIPWALAVIYLHGSQPRIRFSERTFRRVTDIGIFLLYAGLLWTSASLSTDSQRYRWDGHVAQHGIDVYQYTPSESALRSLAWQDSDGFAFPDSLQFRRYRTIYPPASQSVFLVLAVTSDTHPFIWKACWTILILILLVVVDRSVHNDVVRRHLRLFALSPIVLVHGVIDAHLDILTALLTLLGLVLWIRRSTVYSAGSLAFAACMKFISLLVLPAIFLTRGGPRLRFLLVFLGIVIIVFGAWWSPYMFDSLLEFAARWKANSLIGELLPFFGDQRIGRLVISAVALVIMMYVTLRYRKAPMTAAALLLVTLPLFSPVAHVWYLLPPLAVSVIVPLRTTFVWAITSTVYATAVYNEQSGGVFKEYTAAIIIEYVPVYVAWILDVRRGPLTSSSPIGYVNP